ncbi:MAG: phosphoribosyltransferase [Ktedonobacterales bacterium]
MRISGQFRDRREAGQLLAKKLGTYANRPDVLVLGLPRGGVPVAFEVASALGVPLDVMLVRKLGVPGERELAMGAIASGGIRLLNQKVIDALRIPDYAVAEVALEEGRELRRRERLYRGYLPPAVLGGRIVIVVDDGIATGSTMRAALWAIRQQQPARTIVGAPVIAADTCRILQQESDEVVSLLAPDDFLSVGSWYAEFPQTSDEEIQDLLDLAWHRPEGQAEASPPDA